jgi:hypothetical protein
VLLVVMMVMVMTVVVLRLRGQSYTCQNSESNE